MMGATRQARALLLFFVMRAASAHHAPTEYDFGKTIEVEGTIVEAKWQNPHVTLKVRERVANANPVIWEIEGSGVGMLRRANAGASPPKYDEKVRVAGHPSRRGGHRLFGLNLLLANGQELVFEPGGRPRWARAAIGNGGTWFDGRAEASGKGIFRVWSTKLDDPLDGTASDHLTPAAQAKLATWNPVRDSVTKGCEPVGVPMLMEQPYPIEFVQERDRIRLRIELYDTERVIHLSSTTTRESLPKGRLGRSLGKWEGASLVVTTDGITWPFLDYAGTPMSPQASLVERFTPTGDGTRLNYSAVVTDPMYLTAPVTFQRSWIARPNEAVKPYKCVG
jgi:hypothetical protein